MSGFCEGVGEGFELYFPKNVLQYKRKKEPMNKTLFVIGLLVVVVAAALLVLDVIESGVAALIGIVGIGLIAASGSSKMKK